ncbi:lipoprotein LpqH [Tsukamurella tyrosinosolvens]|uniref:lipoprotein LpqH n=1 Tax=Tsukamurella tyrosinosolvens TaxID=57704 RepID=UPI002DD4505F|nr:lipoprotein LpqH [Tsukamurella tyrosinosolvens]MEC4612576.1 lipoprotein LpqH [Tsukamurella tyrosinosolvens]
MNRGVLVLSAVAALVLAGCGTGSDTSGGTSAGTGGDTRTSVKVDGKAVAGINVDATKCVKSGDVLTIGTTDRGGTDNGVAGQLKSGNPPTVIGLNVKSPNVMFTFAPGGIMGHEASVKVDGDRYTITGTATTADPSNLDAGTADKSFEVAITCK